MSDIKRELTDKSTPAIKRLERLMEILRSPGGCSWDRKQTHKSLLPYLIEESYEVIEIIESGDLSHLKEELGDLLCQIVFHAQLARERGEFELDDSIEHLIEKLIRRHPHVFEEQQELDPDQVRDQWEKIKVSSGEKKSALSGLPKSMPALTTAFRMGEKAAGYGFDWSGARDVIEKIEEELCELKVELFDKEKVSTEKIEMEMGDFLFAAASMARKLGIDPEIALRKALNKFRMRFERMEGEINSRNEKFDHYSLAQLEELWQRLKTDES